jgi:hypothetical protein
MDFRPQSINDRWYIWVEDSGYDKEPTKSFDCRVLLLISATRMTTNALLHKQIAEEL